MKSLELNQRLKKGILLSLLLINPLSGNCQTISSGGSSDTLCYEIEEARLLMKWANRGFYCDTLITEYENQREDFIQIIQKKNEQLELSESLIYKLRNEVESERKEKRLWMGISVAGMLSTLFLLLF